MQKLNLPDVTLITVTDIRIDEHRKMLRKCMEGIEFGEVIVLSTENDSISRNEGNKDVVKNYKIAPLKSVDSWNRSIIYEMPTYITTSHVMLVHEDGYIINPHLWNPEWLKLDFIGSPWPLPTDSYSYRSESGKIQRVGNSVSLRSKKLIDLAATRPLRYKFGNNNEDGHITCHNREWLEDKGCKFASLEQAINFSKEHEIPENVGIETFAFHSL